MNLYCSLQDNQTIYHLQLDSKNLAKKQLYITASTTSVANVRVHPGVGRVSPIWCIDY